MFDQTKIALVYDFDGTLSPEPMQHYGVLPSLGEEPKHFWESVKIERKAKSAEELLVYMKEMIELSDRKSVKLDRETFRQHGQTVKLFAGVETWFERINQYVAELSDGIGIEVEHYIVSSGLKEMIEGCTVADKFREIFACEFLYDHYGHPKWPARIISDTSKTQYLFRINKGVLDVNESINSHMPLVERQIPFNNMVYFGDGETDVPSMALMMQNGGHAVAVYAPGDSNKKCIDLKKANRIDYFCEADYREGSDLDRMVKNTLRVLTSRIKLRGEIYNLPPVGPI